MIINLIRIILKFMCKIYFSLSLQNEDGGFATYELTRSYNWLEVALSHYLAHFCLF